MVPSQPEYRGYIPEINGLRGVAILFVILHHFWPKTGFLAQPQLTSIAHLGWIGVDLFFVVSGFLITGILLDTYGKPNYYSNFFARRALRIFPLYYLFLIASWSILPRLDDSGAQFVQSSGSPLWYFMYLGNVREAITGVEPAYVLAPLWSLSIEEQFYLVFPLLVAALGPHRLPWMLIGLVVVAPVFRSLFVVLEPDNERIQYLATFSRMDTLAIGCLLAIGFRRRWWRGDVMQFIHLVLLTAFLALAVAFELGGLDRTRLFCRTVGYSLLGLTFGTLVLWAVWQRDSYITRWLRWSPLVGLGQICYAVYLLQRPTEVVVNKVLEIGDLTLDPALLLGVKITATFGVAVVSWYTFEQPILRLKERFFSQSRKVSDAHHALGAV